MKFFCRAAHGSRYFMLCHTSLFILSLCHQVTFYKTLTSLSIVFIKGHVGLLQLLKWPCRSSFFTHVEPFLFERHLLFNDLMRPRKNLNGWYASGVIITRYVFMVFKLACTFRIIYFVCSDHLLFSYM